MVSRSNHVTRDMQTDRRRLQNLWHLPQKQIGAVAQLHRWTPPLSIRELCSTVELPNESPREQAQLLFKCTITSFRCTLLSLSLFLYLNGELTKTLPQFNVHLHQHITQPNPNITSSPTHIKSCTSQSKSFCKMSQTVLIIGASGRMGVEFINAANKKFADSITMHAFVRNPDKLSDETKGKCASVVVGDATKADDVRRGLQETEATTVIISIGAGDSTGKTDIREKTAKVLMDVVKPGSDYEHVKVVVMSSQGAGGSKIKAGFGMGMLISFHLRHILADHNGQEAAFKEGMGDQASGRLLIVRPTGLSVDKAKGVDSVVTFGDEEKLPSVHIDRADVVEWVLNRMCADDGKFGGEFNLTSV